MATFVVTVAEDLSDGDVSAGDLSLREAIDLTNASPDADRITFADEVDYIALTDTLPTISDSLRLVGGGDLVLDANADGDLDRRTTAEDGSRRGLDIRGDDIAVTIDGLTITGGSTSSGGAGIQSGRKVDLTVVDSRIARNENRGGEDGGGIKALGDLTLRRSTVEGNTCYSSGGGVAVFGDALVWTSLRNRESPPPPKTPPNVGFPPRRPSLG